MNTTAKIVSVIVLFVLVIGGLAWLLVINAHPATAEAAVRTTITDFGSHLQNVSLLAPDASQEIAQTYGPYVDASLISSWQANPSTAPGRSTSSPWPDHIDVTGVTKVDDSTYTATGSVILMTSNEVEHGGNAGIIPVVMTLHKEGGGWLITSYAQGTPQAGTPATIVSTTTTTTTTTVTTPPATTPPSGPTPKPTHGLSITSIAPSSGPSGTFVTLRGTGFDSTSQVVIGTGGISNVSVNGAGTVLTFTMPDSLGAYCLPQNPCPMYLMLLKAGTYTLNVRNADGTNSNGVSFTLTSTNNTFQ